jgi:tRNA dimethylallyltransferase
VYRGFDIGASKPVPEELQGIPHHLLDVREADQLLDAAEFAGLADAAIADIRSRSKLPIVVGGSGLWLRALLRGLVKAPPVDAALRARLNEQALLSGSQVLHARLAEVDVAAAADIHPNDRVRIVRALEVYEQLGQPLGELRRLHALGSPRYRALRVVLDLPPELLTERIEARTSEMLARGFAEEVRGLVARHGRDARPLSAVGYREMVRHVCDGESIEDTVRTINQATRIYARRQRTWLKNEPGERWLCTPDQVLASAGLATLTTFLESP